MNKIKRSNILVLAFALALLPMVSFAQQVTPGTAASSDNIPNATVSTPNGNSTTIGIPQGFSGIFSCNQNGAYAMSVGALGATGGVYVPVADASVELNTGTLVYKECILREVVDAEREAATAGFTQQATNNIQTGRNGATVAAQFALRATGTTELTSRVQTAAVQKLCAKRFVFARSEYSATGKERGRAGIRGSEIQRSGARSRALIRERRQLLRAVIRRETPGTTSSPLVRRAIPHNCLHDRERSYERIRGAEVQCQQNQWLWGGGFYAVTTGSGGPCEQQIVTPSSNVNQSYSTVLAQRVQPIAKCERPRTDGRRALRRHFDAGAFRPRRRHHRTHAADRKFAIVFATSSLARNAEPAINGGQRRSRQSRCRAPGRREITTTS